MEVRGFKGGEHEALRLADSHLCAHGQAATLAPAAPYR